MCVRTQRVTLQTTRERYTKKHANMLLGGAGRLGTLGSRGVCSAAPETQWKTWAELTRSQKAGLIGGALGGCTGLITGGLMGADAADAFFAGGIMGALGAGAGGFLAAGLVLVPEIGLLAVCPLTSVGVHKIKKWYRRSS